MDFRVELRFSRRAGVLAHRESEEVWVQASSIEDLVRQARERSRALENDDYYVAVGWPRVWAEWIKPGGSKGLPLVHYSVDGYNPSILGPFVAKVLVPSQRQTVPLPW